MPSIKEQLEAAEEHIPLPESSEEDDSQSDLSESEHNIEDPFCSESDSDSDGAPDIFSFKSANEDLLSQTRKTAEVIKTHEEERRRKRKELHEQNLLQKEEKRQKIEDKMLPDDVLENLNDDEALEIVDNNEDNVSGEEEIEENVEANIIKEDDIIEEHGPTLFKCKILAAEDKKPNHVPDNVLSFKDRLLYGGRIRREKSSKEAATKRNKQLARR